MGSPLIDLRKLLIRYREEGDDPAFTDFEQAMWTCLWTHAFRVLWDRHLAEDAVQEALVRIALEVQHNRWQPELGVKGWAVKIVYRVAVDHSRKRRRHVFVSDLPNLSRGELSPLDALICQENNDRIQAWLEFHATDMEKLIFLSRFVAEMTLEEIGEQMHPKHQPPAVLKLQRKALAKLAAYLGDGRTPERHLVEGETNG